MDGSVRCQLYRRQPFISNPDLVGRLCNEWPRTPPARATYYRGDAKGYVDYAPCEPA